MFVGWFHLGIIRMGDILDLVWVVFSVPQSIGCVTHHQYQTQEYLLYPRRVVLQQNNVFIV